MATSVAPDPKTCALPRKLSEQLADLREVLADRALTLAETIHFLQERAYLTLIILLTLPFLTPIPLPGVSTAFGIAIAWIALCMAIGKEPYLPQWIRNKRVPAGFFGKVFKFAAWILRFVEKFIRPRFCAITENEAFIRLHSVLILISAAFLLLPLPIPFTNTFPGWAILLVAAGLIERDGVFIIAGYLVFAAGVVTFTFLGDGLAKMAQAVRLWLGW